MAQKSINQLHPGVYGTISSEESTFTTGTGALTMFQADVFEKGPDNQLGFVTSVEEFISKYGEPNYAKYGQGAYNVVNFLRAGGQALVMRVLPKNASYAHAILNVQTKDLAAKKIKKEDGTLVDFPNMAIRPTTVFLQNNLPLSELQNEFLRADRPNNTSADSYTNNFILMVTPTGRGEAYNQLGFRISLSSSFDLSYGFRVYTFEVVEFSDDESISLVEGPFYVSFDRDAISENRESMFIENVINRRSSFVKVTFNDEAYLKVASKVNDTVDPFSLDILSGQAKVTANGKAPTYYDTTVGAELDIRAKLIKYTNSGTVVTEDDRVALNIKEASDKVETALVSLDNSTRELKYSTAETKYSKMTNWYRILRQNTSVSNFTSALGAVLTVGADSVLTGTLGTLKSTVFDGTKVGSKYAKYNLAKQTATTSPTEDNYAAAYALLNEVTGTVKTSFLENITDLFAAYTLTERNSPNPSLTLDYTTNLNNLFSKLSTKDSVSISASEHKANLFNIQERIISYQLGTASGNYLEGIQLLASDLDAEIRFVYDNLLRTAYGQPADFPAKIKTAFDDKTVGGIINSFNSAATTIDDLVSGLYENTSVTRNEALSKMNDASNKLVAIISEAAFKAITTTFATIVDTTVATLFDNAKTLVSATKTMTTIQGEYTYDELLKTARRQLEVERANLTTDAASYYNTNLIDFESSVRLLAGSDGDFAYNAYTSNQDRDSAIQDHLIKAYSGTINSDILDTDLYRFNVILDAGYSTEVKKSIVDLARNIRQDFVFIADDTDGNQFTVSPQESIDWRQSKFNIDSYYTAIYSQGLTYYDEFTGKDLTFTVPNRLASKLPTQAVQTGLHYPVAGQRRGAIDGFKGYTWMPNNAYKEKLYTNRLNYLQTDGSKTFIGSQSTAINTSGPLSNLNNVFTILAMKRELNDLLQSYVFELNNEDTVNSLYSEANAVLNNYVSNQSCEEATATVGRTDYEKQQRILRVSVSVKFSDVVERIVFSISAEK